MTLTTSHNGLDTLVGQLEKGGLFSLGGPWQAWFDGAVDQLENDDSINPRFTDEMAECLGQAEQAIAEGSNCQPALNRLVSLYHANQDSLPLELKWRRRAAGLGAVQLDSSTWEDLHLALDAAQAGQTLAVAGWLEGVEATFLASWESYEEGDVLEEEITTESVLCHRFLMEGTELWLDAVATFRDSLGGPIDRAAILELAEAGQRLLILVQILEQEAADAMERFFAWARN